MQSAKQRTKGEHIFDKWVVRVKDLGQTKSRLLACQATVRCRSQDRLGMLWLRTSPQISVASSTKVIS